MAITQGGSTRGPSDSSRSGKGTTSRRFWTAVLAAALLVATPAAHASAAADPTVPPPAPVIPAATDPATQTAPATQVMPITELAGETTAAASVARATFVGHGQGHLRGMSQWGSYGYAVDHGWSYKQITDHFYGGTVLAANAGNPAMTVRLRAQSGRDLIVTGTDLRVDGATVAGKKAIRVQKVASGQLQVFVAGGCGGPWTKLGGVRANRVVLSRAGQNLADPATLFGVCGADGIRYYGGTVTVLDAEGQIESVVQIATETYLRGVIPRESPAYWGSGGGGKGINALKAQAVAARSYALGSTRKSYAKTCDTTECQVYGGMFFQTYGGAMQALHHANTDRAVKETAGQVRRHGGSTGAIAITEFGASSGGWTQGPTFPPVQDLGDDTTDNNGVHNPYHNWTFGFTVADVASRLGLSTVNDLRVTATTGVGPSGGPATQVTVYTPTGTRTYTADAIRRAMGLHSNWFRVSTDGPARAKAEAVVKALFFDLLGHGPSTQGLQYWTDQLLAGRSRGSVAKAIAGSPERIHLLVKEIYRDALGRTPDSGGLAQWSSTLTRSPYSQVVGGIYGSAEAFRRAGSTNAGWVDLVFRGVLGRPASSASKAYWTKVVIRDGRVAAAKAIADSPTAGVVFVTTVFQQMLDRNPGPENLEPWGPRMANRGLFDLPSAIAGAPEYYNRAQRLYG